MVLNVADYSHSCLRSFISKPCSGIGRKQVYRVSRRNDLDICADILQVARDGANKTGIVYRANLNFKLVEKYLERLMTSGLLRPTKQHRFVTTQKGVEFLRQFQTLLLPMIEQEALEIHP